MTDPAIDAARVAETDMLQLVDVAKRPVSAYRDIAPDAILDELETLGRDLRGLRLLHINATPYGGGVSELLRSMIPLHNDLGLVADWRIIGGGDGFFEATKALHNALQGDPAGLTDAQWSSYRARSEANARELEEEYDVVIVNDPQPAPLPALHGRGDARWIWRCHIDTSRAHPAAWAGLRPYLEAYDAAVYTMREFVPSDFPVDRVEIIPPAIDPLSPKNLTLPDGLARAVLAWIGIDLSRPLVTQVSRFDPWKDPLGVIRAYRLARERHPDLQLALVGSMALDDPQGWSIYEQIEREIKGDPRIHLFTNMSGVGNIEVNAFQRLSDVIVQKSIREGFGLVVSEAMWKGTPVVAGRAGGIPLQVADGVGGILVESIQATADAIVQLLDQPDLSEQLGQSGRERVREHFLLPRLLLDELRLVHDLVQGRQIRRAVAADGSKRDPVCGMTVHSPATRSSRLRGVDYWFCSADCRQRFEADPERFIQDPPGGGGTAPDGSTRRPAGA